MSVGAWWVVLFTGGVTVCGWLCWWASNPQWSARASLADWRRRRVSFYVRGFNRFGWSAVHAARHLADVASAGARNAGPKMPPATNGYAEAVRLVASPLRRSQASLPRARIVTPTASLRRRSGRMGRPMVALLGACAGSLLAAAYLWPVIGNPPQSNQTKVLLLPVVTRNSLVIPKVGTRKDLVKTAILREAIPVPGELPGLPGFWIDDIKRDAVFGPSSRPATRATRGQGPGSMAPMRDGLPGLSGNLPGRDDGEKVKDSSGIGVLHLRITPFTYKYRYIYIRECSYVREGSKAGIRICVDPYRGYIYREKAVNPVNHSYPVVIVHEVSGNSSSILPVTRSDGGVQ